MTDKTLYVTVKMLFFDMTWYWRQKNVGDWRPLARYVDDVEG